MLLDMILCTVLPLALTSTVLKVSGIVPCVRYSTSRLSNAVDRRRRRRRGRTDRQLPCRCTSHTTASHRPPGGRCLKKISFPSAKPGMRQAAHTVQCTVQSTVLQSTVQSTVNSRHVKTYATCTYCTRLLRNTAHTFFALR